MIWDGLATTRLRFDCSQVPVTDRMKFSEGRIFTVIGKICARYILAYDVTLMTNATDESLLFRGKVAQVVTQVL